MKQIAVIGAGTMGNGIAHVFAQKGFKVNLIDTQAAALEKAMQTKQQRHRHLQILLPSLLFKKAFTMQILL
jgi:3-hydroxyacyl-CoA dehydrogenase